jgi:hypothetical protein
VKLPKTQTLAVAGFALLALVVAGAGFLLMVQPQRSKARSVGKQIAAAQAQLESLHSGSGPPPAIRAADLFRLAHAMPGVDDMAGVVLDLSQLAANSKLKLVSIRPSPRVALADGSSALPISVTVDGNWKGLSAFLKTVRRRVELAGRNSLAVTGRLYDIDNVQVQSAPTPNELEAVLTMDAFDYGAPPSPTATAGAANGSTSAGATTTTTTTTSGSGAPQAAGTGSGS